MAIVGLHDVLMVGKDPKNGKVLKGEDGIPGANDQGIFDVSVALKGTSQANITGLDQAPTLDYGNDVVVDAITASAPSPQIAFIFNDLPYDVKNYILGFDKDGIYTGIKPIIGVIIESRTIDKINSVYFGFYRTIMVEEAQNMQTNEAADQRQKDTITAVAIGEPRHDGQPMRKGATVQADFDFKEFQQDVFNLENSDGGNDDNGDQGKE